MWYRLYSDWSAKKWYRYFCITYSFECLFFNRKDIVRVGAGADKPDSQTWHHRPKKSPVISRFSFAPSMYKIYCYILDSRLLAWSEINNKVEDEQNGFRKGRGKIQHISSLANIIETRQKSKLSTFCASIDLKKAYDSINRNIQWAKLTASGI